MPGKLRKSRSRNVTKSNNRPASRQSRKRKTPKGKGKARKTTRRRSKRGGMLFGRKGSKSDSTEKEQLDLFMRKVLEFFFLKVKEELHVNIKTSNWENTLQTLDIHETLLLEFDFTQETGYRITRNLAGEPELDVYGREKSAPSVEVKQQKCDLKYKKFQQAVGKAYNYYKQEEKDKIATLISTIEDERGLNSLELNSLYHTYYSSKSRNPREMFTTKEKACKFK